MTSPENFIRADQDPKIKYVNLPLTEADVLELQAGDQVRLSGYLYTARDAAHRRLVNLLEAGQSLPVDLVNQTIYYVGPTPAKPGQPIGSAGPTTSYRMDSLTIPLLQLGLRAMIGKGNRSTAVVQAMIQYKAVYFCAIGGAAALIARSIKAAEVVAYADLGSEALQRLQVEKMPLIVAIDCQGNNRYEQGPAIWRQQHGFPQPNEIK